MKPITMKRLSFLFALLFIAGFSKAQIQPDQILAGSQNDINYLANGYLKPFGTALAEGLNNGWYSTAKTKNLGRFDLMFTSSIVFIPDADQLFTIDNSQLEEIELVGASSATSATAFGDETSGPELQYRIAPGASNFNLPGGTGFSALPIPMAKLSIGLIKNTEFSFRYLPELSIPTVDDGKVSMLGFAVKHDILQWIPGGKVLPFSVSGFFGYTNLDYSQSIGDGQQLSLSSTGYTVRALVSKKFLFITPYAGLGVNGGSTDIKLTGVFSNPLPGGPDFTDPINIEADDAGGFVGNIGLRLKFLFVVAATVDYTFGAYDAVTAGLGISVDF